jgi:TonB family protein
MTFLHYLVQVNLYLVMFYGFYRLLLFDETFYGLNRTYLVGSAILSFGIPFWYSDYVQSFFITQQVNEVFYTMLSPAVFGVRASAENPFTWYDLLKIFYIICTVFLSIKLIFNLLQLKKLLNNNSAHAKQGAGFSFFNFVFVDKDLQKREVVLEHEYVHIRQLHSADVILFELIAVLCWFNPVVYFYKKSIKNIHEFIADDIASRLEPTKADYAMLLFSQQFGLNPHQLTNNFFHHSTLKRRIEMLQKPRSRKIALLKYGFTAPLFALMLVIASASIARHETIKKVENLVKIAAKMPVPELQIVPFKEMIFKTDTIISGKVISITEGTPIIGVTVSVKGKNEIVFTDKQGNYRIEASSDDELTFSNVGFELNTVPVTDKKIINVSLISEKYPNLPSTIENYTKTSNALHEVVVVGYTKEGKTYNEEVFTTVDENPTFPGGIKEMYKFITQNLRYPTAAQRANTQGKVFVKFIVRKDGSTSDMTVLKGIGNGCDEETVRVIGMMPKWNAGKQNGVPVNVFFTMPVSFVLEGSESKKDEKLTEVMSSKIPTSRSIDDEKITIKGQGKTSSYSINGPFNSDEALWVVDGIIAYNDAMKKIEPQDIESISVLKNANATALYGEKGKNGVILVTTKKAFITKEESKFTITGKQFYTLKVGKNRQIIDAKTANEYPSDRIMQVNVIKINDIKARKTALNEYEEKVLKEGYDGWVDIWVREQ